MKYKDNNGKEYIDCPLGLYDTETHEFLVVVESARLGMDDNSLVLEVEVLQGDGMRVDTLYFRVMDRYSAQDIADCLSIHSQQIRAKT